MTDAETNLTYRIAKHFEMANRDRTKLLEDAGDDSLAQVSAMLDGQAIYNHVLSEAVIDLASAIEAIRHRLDHPA